MAEVKVTELAKTVGASVDRLLSQMKEAGLPHISPEDMVSDEEKQTLLGYLKGLHGEKGGEPKKITLRRKTVSTLKTGNRRTVNIEVRKKRTYVKRSEEDIQAQAELESDVKARQEVEQPPEPLVEPEVVVSPESNPEDVVSKRSSGTDDIEERRLAAIANRRRADEEQRALAEQKGKEQLEEEARKAAEAASALASEEAKKAGKTTKQVPTPASEPVQDKGRRHAKSQDDDEDKLAKKAKKPLGKPGKKKGRLRLDDGEELTTKNRLKTTGVVLKVDNKHTFKKPVDKKTFEVPIADEISVADLAAKMAIKSGLVIKELMKLGVMANINQVIDQETAFLVVEELGHQPVVAVDETVEDELAKQFETINSDVAGQARAPIVTVMGHVDHGKTSLLDRIKKTHVASGEAGGITQHIGAYHVNTPKGMVTFLDTPGHAAFTAMRARGAKATDVVILVVAADDGVMPQTEEAIQHARAAGVPVVVAINKMDKEGADPERVTSELGAKDVIPEEWGGDTQFVKVSAETGEGIDDLLEAILLQSELLELTAPVDVPARGVIVEARVDKGRGVVATALVQQGTLNKGDFMLAGESVGKIRAMTDELKKPIQTAGPSIPVEILGLDEAPDAGDEFFVVADERKAKEIAELRVNKARQDRMSRQQAAKLENMFSDMGSEQVRKLNLVVKTDVRGSLEAINSALNDFATDEVAVDIVASGVGGITESDINLAITTGAIVLGFNVRAGGAAKALAEKESIELRYYSIIYNLLDEVKLALSGMLDPETKEDIVGIAEVRDVFRSPKFGAIAGCMVVEGSVFRNKPIRVLRDDVVIYQGALESLRRFKDEASEVRNGMECGIGVKDYNDVKTGDLIEVYDVTEVKRSL
ncbi:translation initiation factor IF-2 [Porticoccaceae bacterium]|nr:translation initiation factor IF-2 [Porticoccaceae bacterium]MDA8664096.1 translation initiation factor IF-2 [Porticoccaceae bacterium]MDA8682802.1 translation initiation factor IF-2 [Porticoccaceae bacterium]MDB2343488.1 translation initiation factor IF-2 [Porticoccaceae bacterium]